MEKKKISTKAAKAKGRRLQQLTAKKISELLDIPCGKDKLIESREMGQQGCDVKLYGEASKRFKFSIESKNCEKWALPAWIEQAKTNQTKDTDWLLIISKNNYKPIVVLDMDAFFNLCKKAKL